MDGDKNMPEDDALDSSASEQEPGVVESGSVKKAKKPKNKLPPGVMKKRIFILLFALSFIGAVVATSLYFTEKGRADDLARELAAAESVEPEPAESPEPAEPENTCEGGSSYTAEVGEYTLTMPTDYVIINNLDGGFEGGPATSLNIGTCDEDGVNVVDNYTATEATVFTNPASGAYVPPEGAVEIEPITVDGIDATVYRQDALFTSVYIVVNHGDNRTVITGVGSSEEGILAGAINQVVDNIDFEE